MAVPKGGGGGKGRRMARSKSSAGGGGGGSATATAGRSGAHPPAAAGLYRALDSSPGARDNFVKLSDLRERMGGSRKLQDAIIHRERVAGRLGLNSHEGLADSAKLTPAMRAAGIREAGSLLVYASRR